ncbi:hypothetical protein [Clostridium felsineum]|uniref:Uncharacterized protein n=1 Tax=Clostridium felsineum TaxID=36839 RepID=A0A1S8LKY0_9CLOT|nr:hypothetical protein [Clostridium felsineum]URZ08010.1 hypothetical protein CLROS_033760 [Clostridium felsineum]URZ13041.1 hypothetical protein CROST_037910 [Clostridium felsineum]
MKVKKYNKPKVICQNRNGLEGIPFTILLMPMVTPVVNTSAVVATNIG